MKYVAISVGATSNLLLHRHFFSEGDSSRPLVELLTSGEITQPRSWAGYAIHKDSELTCLALPSESVENSLLMSPVAWADVGATDDLLRIADRSFRVFVTIARGSSPNRSWHKYSNGSLLSTFANPNKEAEHRRICFELAKKSATGVVALYAIKPLDVVEDLQNNPPSEEFTADLERLAPRLHELFGLAKVVERPAAGGVIEDHYTGTEYQKTVAENIALNRSYADWRGNLSQAQADFLAAPVEGPIRLHGAAGTGKTLSLLLKVLHECERCEDERKFVLFAHSSTMADALSTALEVFDPGRAIRSVSSATVEVRTLFDWCFKFLGNAIKPGQLLDQDAAESREFQREILANSLEEVFAEQWKGHRPRCSLGFRTMVEKERDTPWFLTLLQHEVACVLKGNRIQPFRLQAYLDLARPPQALPVETEADRRFVFATYQRYEDQLKEFGVFDVDDILVEVLGRLESPLWSRQRQANGYDAVFVDEAHMLNDNERSLVRFLLRDAFALPRIVMVLDLLQTVGDRGVREDSRGRLVTPTTTSEGTRSELSEVHRSSKEILDLVQAIVACGSELYDYQLSVGQQAEASGEKPTLQSCATLAVQAETAFAIAKHWSKQQKWRKHEIALICTTETAMEAVLAYAEENNKPVRVVDRRGDQEAFADASHYSRHVVVTPEFSAGLQFKGVILIDVSEGRVPDSGSAVPGARSAMMRRAVSEIYLALTRAQKRVAILVDETTGPSELLVPAIEAGLVVLY